MKRKNLSRVVLLALVMVSGVEGTRFFGTETAAQTSKTEVWSVPTFEALICVNAEKCWFLRFPFPEIQFSAGFASS